MHAYDRLLALRTLLFALVIVLIALGTVMATDEPFSTPAMRVARLSALGPAVAALAVAIVLAQARSKGELTALGALGSGPLRCSLGALLAGWLLGALATALVLSPFADVSALFPAVSTPAEWRVDDARLIAPGPGIRVGPDGALDWISPAGSPEGAASPGAWTAALAIAPLGLSAPIWAATPASLGWRALSAALSLALVVLLLHAVAASRAHPLALVIAALPLLAQAAVSHRPGARR